MNNGKFEEGRVRTVAKRKEWSAKGAGFTNGAGSQCGDVGGDTCELWYWLDELLS